MQTNKYILAIIMLVVFTSAAHAQLIPNFGAQRSGLSTLSFLKNDVNPRSSAMSGASVALDEDPFAIYTNPAASTTIKSFTASISNYSLGAGVQQSFASVMIPRKDGLSTYGFYVNTLNSGAMEVRTEFQPDGTGEKFFVSNTAFGASYAQKLSDMFSAGISLKYIHEQIENYSNGTAAADVSFLYFTDYKDLKFAVMVQNFGGNSSIEGDELKSTFNRTDPIEPGEFTVPTVFSLGASMVPWKKEKQSLLVSAQLNHPNDNAENYRVGIEYDYYNLVFLRLGAKINVEGQKYPTFGFGLNQPIAGHHVLLQYAANPTEYLGILHTVGLSFSLNNTNRE